MWCQSRRVIALTCHGVICRHLSHRSMRNAEFREKLCRERERHTEEGVSCIRLVVVANPGWFFPPRPGGLFNSATLNTQSPCDIIGNWAPALRKHAGEFGKDVTQAVVNGCRHAREQCRMDQHRLAIVHAKPDCSGPGWGHFLSLSYKRTVILLITCDSTQNRC